jgi:hypothetical protein
MMAGILAGEALVFPRSENPDLGHPRPGILLLASMSLSNRLLYADAMDG